METKTLNEEELKGVAAEFAGQLKGGEVVALRGELGAGKTTFIRAVIQALRPGQRVQSPTFAVMHEYDVEGVVKKIVHIDAYRFKTAEEVDALEVPFGRDGVVVFVEWPERVKGMVDFTHEISIEHAGRGRRIDVKEL